MTLLQALAGSPSRWDTRTYTIHSQTFVARKVVCSCHMLRGVGTALRPCSLPIKPCMGWGGGPCLVHRFSNAGNDGYIPLQDEIGWDKAHLVGFSMGGMVASKFAALWPHRVNSLTLISSTRGGWDTIPRSVRAWKYVLKLARDKRPHTKATLDLKFHFMKKSLQKCAPTSTSDGFLGL